MASNKSLKRRKFWNVTNGTSASGRIVAMQMLRYGSSASTSKCFSFHKAVILSVLVFAMQCLAAVLMAKH